MAPRSILKCHGHSNNSMPNTETCPQDFSYGDPSYAIFLALPFASSHPISPLESPHVHFPPTPALSRIAMTHSSFSYDRRPIEISPNICELPERGERKLDDDGDYDYFFQPHLSDSPPTRSEGMSASPPSDNNTFSPPLHKPIISYSTTHFFPTPFRSTSSTPETHSSPQPALGVYQLSYQSNTSVPPPLVSDFSSSDTDLDTCGTPPEQTSTDTMTQSGIAHISTYFPGGLSVRTSSATQGDDDRLTISSSCHLLSNCGATTFPAKKTRTRTKVKVDSPHFSEGRGENTTDRHKREHKHGTRKSRAGTSFQNSLSDTSSDLDREGCLGGF